MIRKLLRLLRDTAVRYPAILTGCLIYVYYLFVTLDFYKNFKDAHFSSSEFLTHFDALFWMWLLAFALVKILAYREKNHLHEKLLFIQEQQASEAEWKCKRYHSLALELNREVSEPIATASRCVRSVRHQSRNGSAITSKLEAIDVQLSRVIRGLGGFYSGIKSVGP